MPNLKHPIRGRRLTCVALISLLAASLSPCAASQKLFILTLDGFEKSAFFKRYKVERKGQWALKTGGTNFSYAYADPDGTAQNLSVELSGEPFLITSVSVSFNGSSLSNPATLTMRKEKFLRDLFASTHPNIPIEKVIARIKSEHTRNYDGGSDQMPRTIVGTASLYAGTSGGSLVVGMDR